MSDPLEVVAPVNPVVEALVTAPQEPVEAVPVAEAPVVVEMSPVPAVAAPVETPAVPEVKPAETLIAAELDKTKEPVVETPKEPAEGETKAPETEGGQSDEPAPPPKYEPFTLPEGVKLDEERVGKFTELLADLEIKGTDHALVQEFGQKAVDFHISEVKKVAEDLTKFYTTSWEKQKLDWKEQFLADPEIGGNRFQTTVDSALTFLRTHGGTAEQQTEFRNLMETSGLGNHPAMIRLLAKAGAAMSEGRPLAAIKPAEAPKSKISAMYGKSQ